MIFQRLRFDDPIISSYTSYTDQNGVEVLAWGKLTQQQLSARDQYPYEDYEDEATTAAATAAAAAAAAGGGGDGKDDKCSVYVVSFFLNLCFLDHK